MGEEKNEEQKIVFIEGYYYFGCPHCKTTIEVSQNDINCKIFRCGIYKQNGLPISPHTSKTDCMKLVENDLIYGCGKPFIFDKSNVKICDYI